LTHRCMLGSCGWASPDEPDQFSGCRATWHIFEDHPDVWLRTFGDRKPVDPDPRTDEGMMAIRVNIILSGG
jgi:hypothetical protein